MFYCQRMSSDQILHHYIAPRKSLPYIYIYKKERKRKKEKKGLLVREKVTQRENRRVPKMFLE